MPTSNGQTFQLDMESNSVLSMFEELQSPGAGLRDMISAEGVLLLQSRTQIATAIAAMVFGSSRFTRKRSRRQYFNDLSASFPACVSPFIVSGNGRHSYQITLEFCQGQDVPLRVVFDHPEGYVFGYTSVIPLTQDARKEYLNNSLSQYDLCRQHVAEPGTSLGILYAQAAVSLSAVLNQAWNTDDDDASERALRRSFEERATPQLARDGMLQEVDTIRRLKRHASFTLAHYATNRTREWCYEVFNPRIGSLASRFGRLVVHTDQSKDGNDRVRVKLGRPNLPPGTTESSAARMIHTATDLANKLKLSELTTVCRFCCSYAFEGYEVDCTECNCRRGWI